jgi:energy-coupling factor transport system ATP-binding protein
MPDIRIESLRYVYSRGTPFEKVALDDITMDIPSGEYMALLGHTGSGKSTLIQHLNGLLTPASGRVLLDGEDIHRSKEALRAVRFRVGLVFQYPEYQLFEETVYKDIAFGPKNMGLKDKEIEEHVRSGAYFAGVDTALFDASPLELSGGQKRRIAIAGVMAMEPDVLVLDEPIAGLDPAGCRSILANIAEYHRSTGSTVILVTHDMDVAATQAERLVVMRDGAVALSGPPTEVFSRPEELRSMGLDIPDAASLAQAIRSRGVELPGSIYTPGYLAKTLLKMRGGASC